MSIYPKPVENTQPQPSAQDWPNTPTKLEPRTLYIFKEGSSIKEKGAQSPLIVRPTRRGVFVGCTFVTYEALDEIVRRINEEAK